MSEMVERVGEIIAAAIERLASEGQLELRATADFSCKPIARDLILAMREPTEGMCAAGQQVNNLSEEPGHFEFLSRDETAAAWQAMIDEALK